MCAMRNDTTDTTQTTDTQILKLEPSSTFIITCRVWKTKYVFTSASDSTVRYYILAPPGYKHRRHASGWSAIVHAGDNPKYNSLSQSPLVGRCKRAMLWNKFYIEYGGSVQRDVKADEKVIKMKSLKAYNKFRKFFCTGPKELEWSEEDEVAATEEGKAPTNFLEVAHTGHRRYEFGVDGRRYRWTGTRMHAGWFNKFMKMKGIAFDLKLVRLDDDKLIASYKNTYCGDEFGKLNLYTDDYEPVMLDEAIIIQTAFCMVKSEKEKREKVRDILEEIGENSGGGG